MESQLTLLFQHLPTPIEAMKLGRPSKAVEQAFRHFLVLCTFDRHLGRTLNDKLGHLSNELAILCTEICKETRNQGLPWYFEHWMADKLVQENRQPGSTGITQQSQGMLDYLKYISWIIQGRREASLPPFIIFDIQPKATAADVAATVRDWPSYRYIESHRIDTHVCASCRAQNAMRHCGRCRIVENGRNTIFTTSYCSSECQKLHWPVHQNHCYWVKRLYRGALLARRILTLVCEESFLNWPIQEVKLEEGLWNISGLMTAEQMLCGAPLVKPFNPQNIPHPEYAMPAMADRDSGPRMSTSSAALLAIDTFIRPFVTRVQEVEFTPKNAEYCCAVEISGGNKVSPDSESNDDGGGEGASIEPVEGASIEPVEGASIEPGEGASTEPDKGSSTEADQGSPTERFATTGRRFNMLNTHRAFVATVNESGIKVVIDLTGMSYGWHEVMAMWKPYSVVRCDHLLEMNEDLGRAHRDELAKDSSARILHNAVRSLRKDLMKKMIEATTAWIRDKVGENEGENQEKTRPHLKVNPLLGKLTGQSDDIFSASLTNLISSLRTVCKKEVRKMTKGGQFRYYLGINGRMYSTLTKAEGARLKQVWLTKQDFLDYEKANNLRRDTTEEDALNEQEKKQRDREHEVDLMTGLLGLYVERLDQNSKTLKGLNLDKASLRHTKAGISLGSLVSKEKGGKGKGKGKGRA